ncbi:hypothetical protein PEQA60_21790 [Pseudomonas sp. Eqa60]|uniref:hypothetical protein n=1 Tax=Pseudomonas sp. Eqa60 TaxID=2799184 RepID=UPI001BB326C8|nr:hypothetical protein [Pseudomonas sp. Eqa60]BCQ68189.1 hypothetical protein PEQA60_21790 [Pseudomonas sp. Eqa60]
MSDKMREEFEEAFHQARCQGICTAEDRSVAWAFFAASRESLVVELPDAIVGARRYQHAEAAFAHKEGIDECRAAIESLGLRVKP